MYYYLFTKAINSERNVPLVFSGDREGPKEELCFDKMISIESPAQTLKALCKVLFKEMLLLQSYFASIDQQPARLYSTYIAAATREAILLLKRNSKRTIHWQIALTNIYIHIYI